VRKILVTGGQGKLGNKIFNRKDFNHHIIFTTKRKTNEINRPNYSYVETDLTEKNGIDKNIWGVDEVLHMAGATHEKNEENYFKVNSQVTKRLIKVAEDNGIKRFIYLSSQAVGKRGGSYSHSKELAENYLESSKLQWTIIRPSEIYGEDIEGSINSLCGFLQNYRIVPIVGNGNYTINPLHIDDFVDFVKRLLDCNTEKSYRKKYTLAGPKPISFNDFCKTRSRVYKKKHLRVHIPITLCKATSRFLRFLNLSGFVPDQIDRLLLPKNNDIKQATLDYSFKPKPFSTIDSL
jgi:nucleoside-diphosphate-sugar epimerase